MLFSSWYRIKNFLEGRKQSNLHGYTLSWNKKTAGEFKKKYGIDVEDDIKNVSSSAFFNLVSNGKIRVE